MPSLPSPELSPSPLPPSRQPSATRFAPEEPRSAPSLSRAFSEAGSILSERMESATLAAAELLRMPLRCVMLGACCLLLPLGVFLLAPLIVLFLPWLLTIGTTLLLFGGVRVMYIILVSHQHDGPAPISLTTLVTSLNSITLAPPTLAKGGRSGGDNRLRRRATKLSHEEVEAEVEVSEDAERRATDGTLEVRPSLLQHHLHPYNGGRGSVLRNEGSGVSG